MKTREEVEILKHGWMNDPTWDIEYSEGFEDYKDELYLFRIEEERLQLQRKIEQIETKYRHFIEVCHDIFGINKLTNTIAESLLKDRGY